MAVGINEHIYNIDEWLEAASAAGLKPQLLLPRLIEQTHREGRIDQVLGVRPSNDYLPRLLGSTLGRRMLGFQPLLRRAYHDDGLSLVLVAQRG